MSIDDAAAALGCSRRRIFQLLADTKDKFRLESGSIRGTVTVDSILRRLTAIEDGEVAIGRPKNKASSKQKG